MVEISLSGSGEGPGEATTRGYSTTLTRSMNSSPIGQRQTDQGRDDGPIPRRGRSSVRGRVGVAPRPKHVSIIFT